MAREPRSTRHQHGVPRYSLATQRAQSRTNLAPIKPSASHRCSCNTNRQAPSTQRLTIKEENLGADSDGDTSYMAQVQPNYGVNAGPPLCKKHKQALQYIHHPRTASSGPNSKNRKIHLKKGQHIIRVKLYNNNVQNLRKIIKSKKTCKYYYVCRMTETFATPGKRMQQQLRPRQKSTSISNYHGKGLPHGGHGHQCGLRRRISRNSFIKDKHTCTQEKSLMPALSMNGKFIVYKYMDDASLIVIPYAHIFDLMLKALNLPPAIYHHKICPGGKFRVTVTFNAS